MEREAARATVRASDAAAGAGAGTATSPRRAAREEQYEAMRNFVLRDLDTGETHLLADAAAATRVEEQSDAAALIRMQSKERLQRASGSPRSPKTGAFNGTATVEHRESPLASPRFAAAPDHVETSSPRTLAPASLDTALALNGLAASASADHPLAPRSLPMTSDSPARSSDVKLRRRRTSARKRAQSDEMVHRQSQTSRSADLVRVVAHKKRERDFAYMYRWQVVPDAHHGPIRVLAFNPSGKLLATAGYDRTIKIWDVDARVEDRVGVPTSSSADDPQATLMQYQYQRQYLRGGHPMIELYGHTAEVVDMSWSKNDFLASGGMDKTVRLWHATKKMCLRIFWHKDFVTTVRFHPTDEQVCITGTCDGTLSLWQMREEKLLSEAALDDFITSCTITPDGSTALVGTRHGRVKFYSLFDEIQGEWQFVHTTQLDVRSRRAKKGCGKKVAGICFRPNNEELCVSSSDSRIRLYRFDDKALLSKFVGHINEESQLSASFSPCGTFLLTASENRAVCIWEVNNHGFIPKRRETSAAAGSSRRKEAPQPNDKGKNFSMEQFDPHDQAFISAAVFAPRKAKLPHKYTKSAAANQVPYSRRAFGLVIVTASEQGELRVFGCI